MDRSEIATRARAMRPSGPKQLHIIDVADLPCIHRGEKLREITCQTCGSKGVPVAVYACEVHGECARRKSGNREAIEPRGRCAGCEDRQTVAAERIEVKPHNPRVALLTPSLLMGGAERWMLSLCRMLPGMGVDLAGVALAQYGPSDASTVREFERYCRVQASEVRSVGGPAMDAVGLKRFPGSVAFDSIIHNSDIVLTWGIGPLREHLGDWRGPVVFVSHGGCSWTSTVADMALPAVTHRAAVSQWAARIFPDPSAVTVIHNGVEVDRVAPSQSRQAVREAWGLRHGQVAVGYIGRFSREKNPVAAALAVSKLPEHYRAVYVGDGWQREEIENEIRALIGHRAIFAGRCDHIGDALAGLNCVVSAAPSEGFSLAIIEAWLAGVPVVSTPVGAIPELEERWGKLTVPVPVNPSAGDLADAVSQAIEGYGNPLSTARTLAWRDFTAASMARRWADYLRGIVQ